VTFSVIAFGGQPLAYHWTFNEKEIAATNSSLTLSNVTAANVGRYTVFISNASGSTRSEVATLEIPAPSAKSYPDLVKDDGAIGYWRLDETSGLIAEDEIANNDGAYINGVTIGVPGAFPNNTNTAVHFSAARRQKVDVPWTATLNPSVFSVELWARLTGATGTNASPLTSRADTPQRGYLFYVSPTNTWHFWSGQGNFNGWDIILGPRVVPNQWTHLAATYDGAIKRFYVNGNEVGASTASFGRNNTSPLRFGAGATEGAGNFFFEGDVDEPAIYNKALTHAQIIVHYLASQKVPPKLEITLNGRIPLLTWNSGLLQSAASIFGPWEFVLGLNSPFPIDPASSNIRFYRLVSQ
jgi:hypothetical protein